jgi:aspartyl-tRNA(Asn)/glutamyl-tRNA(Gln) amidotransferase subunit B
MESSTGIDFNRAGTPLLEIVSEPDIAGPEEAFAYLSVLQQLVVYGGISDADMEKGQLRCDVNVSVRPVGTEKWGAKIELKNLNSISGVRRALAFEIKRQIDVLEAGGTLEQETRRWDDVRGETQLMRVKESAHDYRYFPDPDLLPVKTAFILEAARRRKPELPWEKRARYVAYFGVTEYDVCAGERPAHRALFRDGCGWGEKTEECRQLDSQRSPECPFRRGQNHSGMPANACGL